MRQEGGLFVYLPSALWYSMQNSQWLCLIFFLLNLLLSQGYEALHGIPFLKAQIATSLNAQLIFPIKMLSEHFQSCSWDFLQPPSVLSSLPFLFMTPSWENIFQNKGAMYSFGVVLPLGLWLSLPVLGFHTGTAQTLLQHFCLQPALLPILQ